MGVLFVGHVGGGILFGFGILGIGWRGVCRQV